MGVKPADPSGADAPQIASILAEVEREEAPPKVVACSIYPVLAYEASAASTVPRARAFSLVADPRGAPPGIPGSGFSVKNHRRGRDRHSAAIGHSLVPFARLYRLVIELIERFTLCVSFREMDLLGDPAPCSGRKCL